MSTPDPGMTAAELRATFDESFTRAVDLVTEPHDELLAIRAGHAEVALRIRETAGIIRCPTLTAMPSRNRALAGLAGVRGTLVAVYSLAELVGDEPGSSRQGWIVLCAGDRSAGLLFDDVVGYERVPASAIHRADEPALGERAGAIVRIGGLPRPLIGIPGLLESIHRTARTSADKER